ncbi:F-box domain-containing protein [Mycena chlorophos]|uniref:F-box domain-containing protein n=1 Tax=Mycena chlorophos TaxID=658473 RepID=A0A8H6SXW7_MYCCL|nr:F-box domain-containing protein [Mycena chlorophos]
MTAPWLTPGLPREDIPLLLRVQGAQETWSLAATELERLQRENAELRERVWYLAKRLEVYHWQADKISVADLPHEILLPILRDALPPWWMLRGIRELTPESIHMHTVDFEMKMSLALVCRSWSAVAIEMLYSNVHLRSVGQVVAFSKALEDRTELGKLVQRLDVGAFVPRGYEVLFDQEMTRIFSLCPRLAHIAFVPLHRIPSMVYKLPAPHTTITSLEFSGRIEFETILDILMQMHETLCCLALEYTGNPLETEPCIEFPRLEELCIHGSSPWNPEPRHEPTLWDWSVPNLQRLWLYGNQHLCHASLSKFGANITFLFLTKWSAVGMCPKLQHLAVTGDAAYDGLRFPKSHSTLQYVDLWCSPEADADADSDSDADADADGGADDFPLRLKIPDIEQCRLQARFPALRKCRIFDATFVHYRDISFALSPIDMPSRTPRAPRLGEFDFETISADHECDSSCSLRKKFQQQREAGHCLAPWLVSLLEHVEPGTVQRDTDLGEYIQLVEQELPRYDPDWTPGDESDGGSCSDSDSEDSDAVEESDSDGEDWEISREEALEIFSRIISK